LAGWTWLAIEPFHFALEPPSEWMAWWSWGASMHLLVSADRHYWTANWRRLVACDLKRSLFGGVIKAVSLLLVKAKHRVISKFPLGE